MTPVLYDGTETAFDHGGVCVLVDATRCVVTQDKEYTYVLEMDYPVSGRHFDEIRIGRIIMAQPAPNEDGEPFDIYAFTVSGDGMATFYARHVSYRLEKYIIGEIRIYTDTMIAQLGVLRNYSVNHIRTQFSVSGRDEAVPNYAYRMKDEVKESELPHSYRDLIINYGKYFTLAYHSGDSTLLDDASLPDIQYKFSRFDVRVYSSRNSTAAEQRRGTERYNPIVVRRNVKSIAYELDYSDVIQYVIPYYVERTQEQDTDDEHYHTYYITDSGPSGSSSPYSATGVNGNGVVTALEWDAAAVDFTDEFDTRPEPQELYSMGVKYYRDNNLGTPYCNLTIDFTQLDPTTDSEYIFPDGGEMYLFDTFPVSFPDIEVEMTMEVVKCTYDVLAERYEKVELGSLQRTIYTQNTHENGKNPVNYTKSRAVTVSPTVEIPVDTMDIEGD